MPEFHETAYGHRFFDAQLPAAINRLADATEESNKLKSYELSRRD